MILPARGEKDGMRPTRSPSRGERSLTGRSARCVLGDNWPKRLRKQLWRLDLRQMPGVLQKPELRARDGLRVVTTIRRVAPVTDRIHWDAQHRTRANSRPNLSPKKTFVSFRMRPVSLFHEHAPDVTRT